MSTRSLDTSGFNASGFDAPAAHIPPPPAHARRPSLRRAARSAGQDLLAMLGEASLAGIATLAFAWGLGELAFILLSR